MNEATRQKRRNLTEARAEYDRIAPGHSEEGRVILLREVAQKWGVTQKSIRERP